jgi:hypothetical protein
MAFLFSVITLYHSKLSSRILYFKWPYADVTYGCQGGVDAALRDYKNRTESIAAVVRAAAEPVRVRQISARDP